MPKINLLEKQVAELIAAGEVVERPASIVKELVENAVDAGATAITVEIQAGGVRYIRITDNGCGIERADVHNAFLRHATSKVRQAEDLSEIRTMGFRGEALASIAAMCRVELLTRTKAEVAGTHYVIAGGEESAIEDAGCPVGTTIIVQDIFYNTPARMKFLKKDISEGNSVAAIVEKAALANPQIAFRFIRDGQQRMQTPGDGKLISVVRCVLGREFAENCICTHYENEGMMLDGCISKPSFSRGSRSMQNFFINTRFVRSKTCMAALEESYKNALMIGKFPSCVLNLTIPPQSVDVNVHPAKIEVRFANEKGIFDLVYYGCKSALGAQHLAPEIKAREIHYNPFAVRTDKTTPVQQRMDVGEYKVMLAAQMEKERPQISRSVKTPSIETVYQPRVVETTAPRPISVQIPQQEKVISSPTDADIPSIDTDLVAVESLNISYMPVCAPAAPIKTSAKELSEPAEVTSETVTSLSEQTEQKSLYEDARVIGELFSTYILLENKNELLLVDKHAAHERLLFNQLLSQGIGEEKQLLIQPISVQLSKEEHAILLEHQAEISRAGFKIEDFGDGFVLIREVAPVLAKSDLPVLLTELAQKLLAGGGRLLPKELEDYYHTAACRSAVKARDKTPIPTLEALIGLLSEDTDAQHCPHGRPVCIRMTRYEIEKKFGRLG